MVTKSFTQAILAVLFGVVTMLHAQEIRPIAPTCDENVNGKMMHRAGVFGRVESWLGVKANPILHNRHWSYGNHSYQRPFGSYTQYLLHTQQWNGVADRLVLYRYDFEDVRSAKLNFRGRYQLQKIASTAIPAGLPITIQPSGVSNTLDRQRQAEVSSRLKELGFEAEAFMVDIGHPQTPGLDGVEAQSIWMKQVRPNVPHRSDREPSRSKGPSSSIWDGIGP